MALQCRSRAAKHGGAGGWRMEDVDDSIAARFLLAHTAVEWGPGCRPEVSSDNLTLENKATCAVAPHVIGGSGLL